METPVNSAPLVTPRSVGIKFGLISALISIVFFLLQTLTGQNAFDNSFNWKSVVAFLITVALIVLAHKNFKDNNGTGYMSYGQGVGIAFWITLVSVIVNFLVVYAYVAFIDTGAMEIFYQTQAEELSKNGMADEQVEMALSWTRTLFWPMYIFFALFFGVLIGVIVSIFTQKKNPEPAF